MNPPPPSFHLLFFEKHIIMIFIQVVGKSARTKLTMFEGQIPSKLIKVSLTFIAKVCATTLPLPISMREEKSSKRLN